MTDSNVTRPNAADPAPTAATAAVPFDPFADDDDELDQLVSGLDNHRAALNTFKQRRTTSRAARLVADGKVELPFIHCKTRKMLWSNRIRVLSRPC